MYRDVYMTPCPTCAATAADQLSTMVNYLNTNCSSAWTKYIWLDISGTSWTSNFTANQIFYQNLLDACLATPGVTCGIYTTY